MKFFSFNYLSILKKRLSLHRNREMTVLIKRYQKEKQIAKVAQLVEHDLAKVGVAGSSPVFRSTKKAKRNSFAFFLYNKTNAQMVELVDTLVSGTSGRKAVQVRVLFWVQ
jgi:hypothetical protein